MLAGTQPLGGSYATALAAEFDAARRTTFLDKADLPLPDVELAGLRRRSAAELGIDAAFLGRAAAALGLDPHIPLEPTAAQGTFHRLFAVHEPGRAPRLLRVAALAGTRWTAAMRLEARVAAALEARGFAVPQAAFAAVDSGTGVRGAQLVDAARGTCANQLDRAEGDTRMRDALRGIGAFVAALHAVPGTDFGPLSLAAIEGDNIRSTFAGVHRSWVDYVLQCFPEHLEVCVRIGAVSAAESSAIAAWVRCGRDLLPRHAGVLLHGDPGPHNFVINDAGWCTAIDWEDALVGDPWFELASLCTFQPERRHGAVFEGYGMAPNPADRSWVLFWLYFLRVALAKTVHRHRFAVADLPGREPASRRIQLALARLGEAK